jgi:hypothetical protein
MCYHQTQPESFRIYQRNSSNTVQISIEISGIFLNSMELYIQVNNDDWKVLPIHFSHFKLRSTYNLTGIGFYDLKFRLMFKGRKLWCHKIHHIGVGDVFLIAGQSNSANSGQNRLIPQTEGVYALGKKKWQVAADPQPRASNNKGSPWPAMGDFLFQQTRIPVGVISVGVGGTAVRRWLPQSNDCYLRLFKVLKYLGPYGAKIILWHQGESDAGDRTSTENYVKELSIIIDQSRIDAGWEIPWMIAIASFNPKCNESDRQPIAAAQKELWNYPGVLEGPSTDDLIDSTWRHDMIHFNEKGLREHGKRWAMKILDAFYK